MREDDLYDHSEDFKMLNQHHNKSNKYKIVNLQMFANDMTGYMFSSELNALLDEIPVAAAKEGSKFRIKFIDQVAPSSLWQVLKGTKSTSGFGSLILSNQYHFQVLVKVVSRLRKLLQESEVKIFQIQQKIETF